MVVEGFRPEQQETNKLYHASVDQKAKLVLMYFEREGRDWGATHKALTAVLGSSRSTTLWRWIILARDLHEEVRRHLVTLGLRDLPQRFLVGNRFLTGKGDEARFRLKPEWARVALTWYKTAMVNGTPPTAQSFVSDFCLPAKHAEAWETSQAKIFGVVATGFRAFARSVERLKMESGRKAILRWASDPELRKRKNFGLEELNALVEEMERTKAGTVRSATVASDAADKPDSAPGASREPDPSVPDASGLGAEEVDDGLLEECVEEASWGWTGSPVREAPEAGSSERSQPDCIPRLPPLYVCSGLLRLWRHLACCFVWHSDSCVWGVCIVFLGRVSPTRSDRPHQASPQHGEDPVAVKAWSLAEAEMVGISTHTDVEGWRQEVNTSLHPRSKAILYVECPTSRAATFHNLFKLVETLPSPFSVYVPVGHRLELLGALSAALLKKFPDRPTFCVQLSMGRQSARVRPTYALYIPLQGAEDRPQEESSDRKFT